MGVERESIAALSCAGSRGLHTMEVHSPIDHEAVIEHHRFSRIRIELRRQRSCLCREWNAARRIARGACLTRPGGCECTVRSIRLTGSG